MKRKAMTIFGAAGMLAVIGAAIAQPPPMRKHRVKQAGELRKLPSTASPPAANRVSIRIEGNDRVITSNGIPKHKTGSFPNRGNPNRISAQSHQYRIPAKPEPAAQITPLRGEFGVAVNGVPFDPGAAEFYQGNPQWQYEALSGAINLGIDMSHAHVQPNGKYHYHGLPTGLLGDIQVSAQRHSPLVGWAADGFPIYAVYGWKDPKDASSEVIALRSSYRVKRGSRPGGEDGPGGIYDGTFVRDYEFVQGSGDLDRCNGRFTVTPEFPGGTYAYFLSEDWPVIPRSFRGQPSSDFMHGPGGNGRQAGMNRRGRPGGGRDSSARDPFRPGRGEGFGRGEDARPSRSRMDPVKPGTILPDFLKQSLRLSADQERQLDALQRDVDRRLQEILTQRQLQLLEGPPRR